MTIKEEEILPLFTAIMDKNCNISYEVFSKLLGELENVPFFLIFLYKYIYIEYNKICYEW